MENRPRAIFERLFGDGGGSGAKARLAYRSVLDAVTDDVKRLRGRLGAADRGKIDQYLEAVRDVERRIQLAEAQGDRELPRLGGPIGLPPLLSHYYQVIAGRVGLTPATDNNPGFSIPVRPEINDRA